jgi:hypothetical protein
MPRTALETNPVLWVAVDVFQDRVNSEVLARVSLRECPCLVPKLKTYIK